MQVVIVYLWHLTKAGHSSNGPPDTSCLVYPYPSPQCLGGLGHSPVVSLTRALAPISKKPLKVILC
jgi:hypothetical protein